MTRPEADKALADAIIDRARAYGMCPPDTILASYGIIAHWAPFEEGSSHYTTHYHSKAIPAHEAVGLFTVALDIATNQQGDDD